MTYAIKMVRREDKESLFVRTKAEFPGFMPCFQHYDDVEPETFHSEETASALAEQFQNALTEDDPITRVDFEVVPIPNN